MKIGVKQPATKKETHIATVTQEPRLAAKEGF